MRNPELDAKLDELVNAIHDKKRKQTTNSGIVLGEIKTNVSKPSCPKHKVDMAFDASSGKWRCPQNGCNISATRSEPKEIKIAPTAKKIRYSYSVAEGVYYAHYDDQLILLPKGSASFMPYTPYEMTRNSEGDEYIGEIVIKLTDKEYKVH